MRIGLKAKQTEHDKEIEAEQGLVNNLKAVREKLTKIEDTEKELNTAKFNITQVKAQMNALQKQIDSTRKRQVTDEDIEQVETELTGVKQEIGELEALAKDLEQYQAAVKTFQESTTNKSKYETAIAIYNKLAKLLAPDGIINDILQTVVGTFQERIDQSNSILGDKISIDKTGFSFKIGQKTEAMLDKKGSEMQRLAWIISEAIAHFSGLRVWLCDRVDILDETNKRQLLGLIQQVQGDYDTIILLGTKGTRPESVPNNNGMKFFWVENGVIK